MLNKNKFSNEKNNDVSWLDRVRIWISLNSFPKMKNSSQSNLSKLKNENENIFRGLKTKTQKIFRSWKPKTRKFFWVEKRKRWEKIKSSTEMYFRCTHMIPNESRIESFTLWISSPDKITWTYHTSLGVTYSAS